MGEFNFRIFFVFSSSYAGRLYLGEAILEIVKYSARISGCIKYTSEIYTELIKHSVDHTLCATHIMTHIKN